ncbi:hypothetical protein BDV09DRAFT_98989 [Aspergillus tetrazonus]
MYVRRPAVGCGVTRGSGMWNDGGRWQRTFIIGQVLTVCSDAVSKLLLFSLAGCSISRNTAQLKTRCLGSLGVCQMISYQRCPQYYIDFLWNGWSRSDLHVCWSSIRASTLCSIVATLISKGHRSCRPMEMAAAIVKCDGQRSGYPRCPGDCYAYMLSCICAHGVALAFLSDWYSWYSLGSGRSCRDTFGLPLHSY